MEKFIPELKKYMLKKMYDGTDVTDEKYKKMAYPSWLRLMNFTTKRVQIKEFGSVMMMETKALFGFMKLFTVAFTPNTGKDVPFLLVDCMEMGKIGLAYVEYYDCTGKKLEFPKLEEIAGEFEGVPNYNETEAWYVKERMKGSMIKGGKGADPATLLALVSKSIDAYLEYAEKAPADPENLKGLKAFQKRMVEEGNPSQPTMRKVLGNEGADRFFTEYVMPLK